MSVHAGEIDMIYVFSRDRTVQAQLADQLSNLAADFYRISKAQIPEHDDIMLVKITILSRNFVGHYRANVENIFGPEIEFELTKA